MTLGAFRGATGLEKIWAEVFYGGNG